MDQDQIMDWNRMQFIGFFFRSFYEFNLQKKRIEENKNLNTEDGMTLNTDVHFLLTVSYNIKKMIDRLLEDFKDNELLNSICLKFKSNPIISEIEIIRGHLEHPHDGRVYGFGRNNNTLKNPHSRGFYDTNTNIYDYGGDTVNLETVFKVFLDLEKDLLDHF